MHTLRSIAISPLQRCAQRFLSYRNFVLLLRLETMSWFFFCCSNRPHLFFCFSSPPQRIRSFIRTSSRTLQQLRVRTYTCVTGPFCLKGSFHSEAITRSVDCCANIIICVRLLFPHYSSTVTCRLFKRREEERDRRSTRARARG